MSETKACSCCGEEKPLSEFHKKSNTRDGLQYDCKSCNSMLSTKYKRARQQKNPFKEAHIRKRNGAKAALIAYDLTPEYLRNMWEEQDGKCAALGLELDLLAPFGTDHKATIDRIVPSVGYTQGNVKWVSMLANRVKTDCIDPEVFIKIAEYVRNCNDIEEPEFDFSFPD